MSLATAAVAPRTFSRRQAVGATVAAAAVASTMVGGTAAASTTATGAAPARAARAALSGNVMSSDPVLHLLRRATFGLTQGQLTAARQRGVDAWLDDQLHPDRLDDSIMSAMLTMYPALSETQDQINQRTTVAQRQDASGQLVEGTLARQVWSNRQLFEVMVDFWSNHFNVLTPGFATYTTKVIEDRDVIRKNALGRFEDLLLADARSPAMLAFLNNSESVAESPNENYGRELLELHTVGIEAGYTEADVHDSANVLTGRTIGDDNRFLYNASVHYVGPVRILGWYSSNASAAGGLAASDGYLRYLARHPSTASRVCRKLVTRFVSDVPPESLVSALATVYLDNGTAIVPVLQALFASAEFAGSAGQKTRRPAEDLIATMRILGVNPPTRKAGKSDKENRKPFTTVLGVASNTLSQAPLGAVPPTGYPDIAVAWSSVSDTLARSNIHYQYVRTSPTGLVKPSLSTLLSGPAMATMGAMIDRLTVAVTGQLFRSDHRQALLTFAGMTDAAPYNQVEVDKWLQNLTEMVLDSPYLLLR